MSQTIPRLVIAATQSSSGKTTITCGILAALRKRGFVPQAYKIGPDYIDPGYHAQASGRPAHNLDTWLMDESAMTRVFVSTAAGADLAVIEGVMGLYDGGRGGVSSTATISKVLGAPVVLVIDCRSMGDSAAAVALGFREYDTSVDLRGVILNRLGSDSHRRLITEAMDRIGIPVLGAIRRDPRLNVTERHLGLITVEENREHALDPLVENVETSVDLDALLAIARSAPQIPVQSRPTAQSQVRATIAVARDAAFSFYYPESLAELQHAGAQIVTFSPLDDAKIPDCDGLIFGGGFPESFAAHLSSNVTMKGSIASAAADGMPIYAECGGYMYLTRQLTDFDGKSYPMVGLVPASCTMTQKLQTVGYVEATLLRNTVLGRTGTTVRGHEFHFSTDETDAPDSAAWQIVKKRTGASRPAGYATKNIVASYLHLHFAGFPDLARSFVDACAAYHSKR